MRVVILFLAALLVRPGHAAPGDLKWSFAAEGAVRSSPALAPNGWIIFASHDKNIYAVDPASGLARWKTPTDGLVVSSPAITETAVYIGVTNGLLALDITTGDPLWHFHTNAVFSTPSILADGSIAFATESPEVYCLNADTGDLKWSANLYGLYPMKTSYSSPVADSNGIIFISASRAPFFGSYGALGSLHALDSASGQVLWRVQGTNAFQGSVALGQDGTLYLGGFDKAVHALDPLTGTNKWAHLTGDSISASPAIGPDGTLYIGSHGGYFYALDSHTGDRKWRFLTGDSIHSTAAIAADGTVYFGSYDKNLYALDGQTGEKKWSFATGGLVLSSPLIGPDGTVYIGSFDGNLYAFEGSAPMAETGWPTFKGNAQRTGLRN